jgi:hypothetical protein
LKIRISRIEDALHASQLRVYQSLARFSVLEIGRRWGKTTFGQQVAMDRAIEGKSVAWFAPTYRFLSESLREFERALHPIIRSIDRAEKRIELKTRGVVDFWSCDDEDAGRGRSYDLVVIDEAGFVPKLLSSWQAAIYPTLTDRRGSAIFLGTPKGCGDFHRLYLQAEGDTSGDWRAFRIGSMENPMIDPAEIEMARKMLPASIFAQEMEGVPAEDGGNPFGIDAIRECVGALSTAEPAWWGVDLAKSHDWTVAVALDADGCVCRLERWQTPWHVTRERLAKLIGQTPAQIDSTGVGDPICEDLRKVCHRTEGFKFTSQSKQQLMEGLQIAIQTREIRFPEGWLRTELESFGFRYSGRGAVQYEATAGHDDGVCALALAQHARRAHRPLRLSIL